MSTGNEDDDELLKQIAARESLDKPRRWQHYLHVPTEQVAYGVAAPLDALGWAVYILPPETAGDDEPAWCVIAELTNVVLTANLVRSTRELFETITARLPGTEYDGWQASMEWDEKLDGRDWPDSLE